MVGACLWFNTSLPSRSLSTCSCVSAWPLTASVRTTGYKKHTLIHNIVFCTFTQHHTHLCEFIGHVFCRMITHYCVSIRGHCDFHITETETCIRQHNDSVSDMGEVWHNNCKCITVTEHLSVHLSRHYVCIIWKHWPVVVNGWTADSRFVVRWQKSSCWNKKTFCYNLWVESKNIEAKTAQNHSFIRSEML